MYSSQIRALAPATCATDRFQLELDRCSNLLNASVGTDSKSVTTKLEPTGALPTITAAAGTAAIGTATPAPSTTGNGSAVVWPAPSDGSVIGVAAPTASVSAASVPAGADSPQPGVFPDMRGVDPYSFYTVRSDETYLTYLYRTGVSNTNLLIGIPSHELDSACMVDRTHIPHIAIDEDTEIDLFDPLRMVDPPFAGETYLSYYQRT